MRSSLVPCTACRRHVHLSDGVCPFCGGAVVPTMVPASPTKLLSRAAVMAIAATLVPACSSSDPEPQTSDAAGDTFFSMDAAYGGPPDTGTPPDTGNAPLYGGPFDTGATDSASSDAADASDASSD